MEWRTQLFTMLVMVILSAAHVAKSTGEDTIAAGQLLRTNQTIVSISQTFALGFFDAGNSTHHRFHLAVWYHTIPGKTVVWVANRAVPLTDPAGAATVTPDGNLAVISGGSAVIWSTSVTTGEQPTSAVLGETGNLVLRDGGGRLLWQSFDHPTDTYLPGMKLRLNLTTGVATGLVSWGAAGDPSTGEYYVGLDPAWPAQFIMLRRSARRWRSTMWSNRLFSEAMALNGVRAYTMYFTVVTMGDEMSLTISVSDHALAWRFQLNRSGILEQHSWLPESGKWDLAWNRPRIACHLYAHCGPNGVCNRNGSPECMCLAGYQPKAEVEWERYNWSAGCERRVGVGCGGGDGFLRLGPIKLPDLPVSVDGLSVEECGDWCLRNCSCSAYSYANLSFGPSPRCLHWTGQLMDLEENYASGQDLFIKLSRTELDRLNTVASEKRTNLVVILVPTICGVVIVTCALVCLVRRRFTRRGRRMNLIGIDKSLVGDDFPLFSFATIKDATDNFSTVNKLGEGGFGPVYKGKLTNGDEIAAKRLSQSSRQGFHEFKNEVELIAKLQHRNLVKLLGWCIHKKEKLLIYEFLPNKSLDKFLFEPSRQSELNWGKRFHIIEGIAQGLLYLHHHSILKIIHRDLKTSNILLDGDMNPKISDFGLARIVGGNQSKKNTSKIVGTYGYMSPEYALDGRFSEKSDVFSFGVILLELISGKRSTGYYQFKHSLNLLGYAWLLWKEDRFLELIDPSISESCVTQEVVRCIHIALLCVQEDVDDRPTMSSVILMFSENTSLPRPNEPAFSVGKGTPSTHSSSNSFMYFSVINSPVETGGSK